MVGKKAPFIIIIICDNKIKARSDWLKGMI